MYKKISSDPTFESQQISIALFLKYFRTTRPTLSQYSSLKILVEGLFGKKISAYFCTIQETKHG